MVGFRSPGGAGPKLNRSCFVCGVLAWFVLVCTWRAALWSQRPCKNVAGLPDKSLGRPASGTEDVDGVHKQPRREIRPENFRLHIKLLTFDRPESAMRCLRSLRSADYKGDEVSLDVFLDFTFNHVSGPRWSASARERVRISHNLLQRIDSFDWPHGPMSVHYRTVNVGVQPQWLEAFWPITMNDFAFIVEDDMEVSPMYYQFFKRLVFNYYYNQSNFDPSIYGVSFQRQRFVPAERANQMRMTEGEPFLYQLVGTWGQFVFPGPWRDFRIWYDDHRYNASREPLIGNMRTTGFFQRKGNRLWTPWFVKWAHARGAFNLYPSFAGNLSLSVSHRDRGVSYAAKGGTLGPDAQLITPQDVADNLTFLSSPPTTQLLRFNYCFHKVPWQKLAETPGEIRALIQRVQRERTIILVMIPPDSLHMHRNWLCHVEGLSIPNSILVSTNREIALDLSRRGHATILLRSQNPNFATRRLWTNHHVTLVRRALEWQFHVLILPANSIVFANPTKHALSDPSANIISHIDRAAPSQSLVFLRSSAPVKAAWKALASAWGASANHSELLYDLDRVPGVAGKSFVPQLLVVGSPPLANRTVVEDRANVVALPVYVVNATSGEGESVRALKGLGLWALDDHDFACTSVVCRRDRPTVSLVSA